MPKPKRAIRHLRKATAAEARVYFAELATALDRDPFAIFANIAHSCATLKTDMRAAIARILLRAEEPSLREAACGFLLDRDGACAGLVAGLIAKEAPLMPAPAIMVERLARMRPWLAKERRGPLAAAIRALRARIAAPCKRAPVEIHKWAASLVDDSGRQSLSAFVKNVSRPAFAIVHIGEREGVTDAFVRPLYGPDEPCDARAHIWSQSESVQVPRAWWERRLWEALARNLAHAPPPFGLVQVAETLDLRFSPPRTAEPLARIEQLRVALAPAHTNAEPRAALAGDSGRATGAAV